MDDMTSETTTEYAEALARAAAYTDAVGLSDGTDRPATTADEAAALGIGEQLRYYNERNA